MKTKTIIGVFLSLLWFSICYAQNVQVETILDLDASGGVTFGPDGNIYISDFGPALGSPSVNTKVYKVEYGTWEVSEVASGFSGASGSRFDSEGNFYQSNPSGARVSKLSTDGNLNINWVTGMSAPIGITNDNDDNLYVCNCGNNTIRKITPTGISSIFASSTLFNCPNGITIDLNGNLYVCNFSDGRIIKITPDGTSSLFKTLPTYGGVGNGHLTFSNNFLFVATIGVGQIYKISLNGESEIIAGIPQGFSNNDGPAMQATFSKPNGIAASITGDTMWVNCSVPTWITNSNALHPGKVRMITGICSLPDVDCPLLTDVKEYNTITTNSFVSLLQPTPNPAIKETKLVYQIHKKTQFIKIKVLDSKGQEVQTLMEQRKPKGEHSIYMNTNKWSSGLYYLRLEGEGFVLTQKLIIQ